MLVNKILLSPIRENITCPKDLLSLGFHVGNLRELYGSGVRSSINLRVGCSPTLRLKGFQVGRGIFKWTGVQYYSRKPRSLRVSAGISESFRRSRKCGDQSES